MTHFSCDFPNTICVPKMFAQDMRNKKCESFQSEVAAAKDYSTHTDSQFEESAENNRLFSKIACVLCSADKLTVNKHEYVDVWCNKVMKYCNLIIFVYKCTSLPLSNIYWAPFFSAVWMSEPFLHHVWVDVFFILRCAGIFVEDGTPVCESE